MYGSSTGLMPIQDKISHELIIEKKESCIGGQNEADRLFNWNIGGKKRIKIADKRAITPPNLLGIDRRIAYNYKEYYSGWIWVGASNLLASMKFSGSISMFGNNVVIIINMVMTNINPIRSFLVKYIWNDVRSLF